MVQAGVQSQSAKDRLRSVRDTLKFAIKKLTLMFSRNIDTISLKLSKDL